MFFNSLFKTVKMMMTKRTVCAPNMTVLDPNNALYHSHITVFALNIFPSNKTNNCIFTKYNCISPQIQKVLETNFSSMWKFVFERLQNFLISSKNKRYPCLKNVCHAEALCLRRKKVCHTESLCLIRNCLSQWVTNIFSNTVIFLR